MVVIAAASAAAWIGASALTIKLREPSGLIKPTQPSLCHHTVRGTMRNKLAVCVMGSLFALAMFSPARADILWHFVQVTCLPDARQFAVRTFNQYNTPLPPGHGIITAEEIKDEPWRCEMPAVGRGPAVKIEVKGVTGKPGNGFCQGEGLEAVEIVVNGARAATVEMTGCGNSRDTMTTVQGNGVGYELLHCVSEFADNTPNAASYKDTKCSGRNITE
jgi:hypothetical protein